MITTLTSPTVARSSEPVALRLRVVESSQTEAALALWRELEQRVGTAPLMASEAWTRTWLRHYGDTVRYRFLLAETSDADRSDPHLTQGLRSKYTCGIALITESHEAKAPLLTLQTRHLGTAGDPPSEGAVVEYNSLLADPDHRPLFIRAVADWFATEAEGDVVCLDGFTKSEAADISADWSPLEVRERESKYLDLDAVRTGGTDVISALGRSTRANLRRKLREYGDLQIEWAQSLAQAEEIFSELIELHQARWMAVGQPGAFHSRRFTGFQRSLLRELFPTGRCVVFRVRHQGATVGCLLLLNDRGRLLDYLSGLADFEQKPSPGLVAHYLCQCEALARGYSAYDFLVGDKRHKENLSTHSQILTWTRWSRPSVKMQILQALTQLKRRFTVSSTLTPSPTGSSDAGRGEQQQTTIPTALSTREQE
jgi:hypothetical protein